MANKSWWTVSRRRVSPRLRILCFPYAGGGASAYHAWGSLLPHDIEVCALQLPGRESRIAEASIDTWPLLLERLAEATVPLLDVPTVFFGHSMGALIAYHLACQVTPGLLIASGAGPSPASRASMVSRGCDEQLVNRLRELEGTSAQVLNNPELLELVLPAFRADMRLCEDYGDPKAVLRCPIVALGGSADAEVPAKELLHWKHRTEARFKMQMFDGGHFFVRDPEVPAWLTGLLGEHCRPTVREQVQGSYPMPADGRSLLRSTANIIG